MDVTPALSPWAVLAIVGSTTVLYALYNLAISSQVRRRLIAFHGCRDPNSYPHKDILFGLDAFWDSVRAGKACTYLAREQRLHQLYGNTFEARFLGGKVVNTAEPDNIKALLSTQFGDYGLGARRRKAFGPLFGHSIFLSDGARWESSRALFRPCFQRAQMVETDRFEPHVSHFLRAIPRDGNTIDLALLFHRLAADIATDFLFGESIRSLENPERLETGVLKAMHDSQSGCEMRWLLGSLSSIVPQSSFFKNIKIVHDYIEKHVNRALEQDHIRKPHYDDRDSDDAIRPVKLVCSEQLVERTRHRKTLRDELLTLYFAGSDTVAALLISTIFAVSKRPDVWRRLRDDVCHLNGQSPSSSQLKKIQYVEYCIYEALRLYPIQPSNSRVAYKDTVLPLGGGVDGLSPIFVARQTMVHFSVYTLHRRRDLWGNDADEFRPERWANEKHTWKYIPFLGGPRICIGKDFGMREAAYILVRMVQTFKNIESRDSAPWIEAISLACTSRNGAKVSLTP